MKIPNENNAITITTKNYIEKGAKLNILPPSEITIIEKTEDYIVLESSLGITEIKENGGINLMSEDKTIKINKGESKNITLPMFDYFHSVVIKY